MTYRELKALNPSFRQSWLPLGKHRVVVPRERVDAFVTALGSGAQLLGRRAADLPVPALAESPAERSSAPVATIEEP